VRELVLKMSMSADGFVGAPDGGIDWIFRTQDEESTKWTVETLERAGVHIMGRRTFYDMTAYWPYSNEPFASPMNRIPKIVFSRSPLKQLGRGRTSAALEDARRANQRRDSTVTADQATLAAEWAASPRASGPLVEEIMKLKNQSGGFILAHGGAGFARSLVKSGLIDEYRLLVHPVVLGRGETIFSGLKRPLDFQLVSSDRFKKGAIGLVYRPIKRE
jgi:dihydrofolate reductase